MIKRVLIANRSEIALRLQASCHAQGIETVAIFSPEDQHASFVYRATRAYPLTLSGAPAYFAQDEIIQIALKAGADAIHPGYGFLSENATFAQKVIDAGLTWVGPASRCIKLMGDKVQARDIMIEAGVPVVPGFVMRDMSAFGQARAKVQATELGYPVIIKDPKSGGGKAMRRVDHVDEFDFAWELVVAESKKLTQSDFLLVEKYIQQGRHIEVQVAGDGTDYIHLFERDCSIQRRHQKVIEETACNFIAPRVLEQMYRIACRAAQAVQYNNIGTIEFIVTQDEQFYFLEMNTRLQVEHAVTEMTTGVDLVALQLHIAQHKKLPYTQDAISRRGHAIQCRLYAEDPAQRFTPSTGTLRHLALPIGPFVRIDHDLEQGKAITPFFDPMIAKIVTLGATRAQSIAHMLVALAQCKIEGIKTNRDFLSNILLSPEFQSGQFHTQLVADPGFMSRMVTPADTPVSDMEIAGIAALLYKQLAVDVEHTAVSAVKRRWKDQQWR